MFVMRLFVILSMFLVSGLNAFARPVLLELFTSQGCPSCPAGEAVIDELNTRDDFFALAFHVDYWDKKGWKDPYGQPIFTQRQTVYMNNMGNSTLYTPQVVIDGTEEANASWGWRVKMKAAAVREKMVDVPMTFKEFQGNKMLDLPTYTLNEPVDVWYAVYTPKTETDVSSGENKGKHFSSTHVVRQYGYLLNWDGQAALVNLPKKDKETDSLVVVVQKKKQGEVLGLLMDAN